MNTPTHLQVATPAPFKSGLHRRVPCDRSLLFAFALTTVALVGNVNAADTATTTWKDTSTSTSFAAAGNWTAGVPTGSISPVFAPTTTYTYQPTLVAAKTVQGIWTTGASGGVTTTLGGAYALTLGGNAVLGGIVDAGILLDGDGNNSLTIATSSITFSAATNFVVNNAATLTVSGAIAINGNKSLTLGGNNASGIINLDGPITGTSSASTLTINTAGKVNLAGTETYTGATTITNGTVTVTGTMGNTAIAVNGGKLNLNSVGAVTQNTLTMNGGLYAQSVDNALSGAANLALGANSGTVTMTRANNFTGSVTLNGGVLNTTTAAINGSDVTKGIVFNSGTMQAAAGGINTAKAITMTGAGTFDTNRNDSVLSGTISSTGAFTKVGAGTLTLSGSNTYSGGTNINGGTLALGHNRALGTAGTISFGGGTLRFSDSNTNDYSSRFSTATNQAVKIDTYGKNISFATALTSSGGDLTLNDTNATTGKLTLSAINTYTGATTINSGVLALAGAGSIANSSAINIASGAKFDVTGVSGGTYNVASGQSIKGNGTIAGNISLGMGAILAPGNSPGSLTTIGDVTLASGGTYQWQINNVAGTKGADAGWDWMNITGTLNIAATSLNQFTIDIQGLDLTNAQGSVSGWNLAMSGTWTIATASGGITGFGDGSEFNLQTANFTNFNSTNGNFSLAASGNDLNLIYTAAVPEPGTWALLTGGLGLLAFAQKLRRRSNT